MRQVPYVPGTLTLNEMLKNTSNMMLTSFFTYDPFVNNCQDFLLAFLRSSKLGTQETGAFIKQPVKDLMKGTPGFVQQAKDAVFSLASWLRRKKEDLGLRKGGIVKRRKPTKRFGSH